MGYLGFDIAALIVSFAAFGGGPPLGPLMFADVIGQLGGLIPLPVGSGGTDGGLIGAMVLYGSSLSQATAAVLAYRAFQLGIPAVLGTFAFAHLRKTLSRSPSAVAAWPAGRAALDALHPFALGGVRPAGRSRTRRSASVRPRRWPPAPRWPSLTSAHPFEPPGGADGHARCDNLAGAGAIWRNCTISAANCAKPPGRGQSCRIRQGVN